MFAKVIMDWINDTTIQEVWIQNKILIQNTDGKKLYHKTKNKCSVIIQATIFFILTFSPTEKKSSTQTQAMLNKPGLAKGYRI